MEEAKEWKKGKARIMSLKQSTGTNKTGFEKWIMLLKTSILALFLENTS